MCRAFSNIYINNALKIGLSENKKNYDAIDICLMQESVRFNKLIVYMEKSLKELLQAIKG